MGGDTGWRIASALTAIKLKHFKMDTLKTHVYLSENTLKMK